MKKRDDKIADETALNNDLEAFEEWESGDEAGAAPAEAAAGATDDDLLDDDLDMPSFEGFPENSPAEKPVAKSSQPEPDPETAADAMADEIAGLAPDVPVTMVAVIGKTTTDVGRLINYRVGEVIDLSRAPSEAVDVVANGKLFAKGELVEMDGKLGVRILKMVR
jgi:flagellar motor switch/type III secretory pathway protein FliN